MIDTVLNLAAVFVFSFAVGRFIAFLVDNWRLNREYDRMMREFDEFWEREEQAWREKHNAAMREADAKFTELKITLDNWRPTPPDSESNRA